MVAQPHNQGMCYTIFFQNYDKFLHFRLKKNAFLFDSQSKFFCLML